MAPKVRKPRFSGASVEPIAADAALVLASSAAAAAAAPLPAVKRRRQAGRRDSDEQVERVVEARLAHIPPVLWEAKVNSGGETLRSAIKAELKRNAPQNKRISTKFWATVNTEFDLCVNLGDALAEPPDGEDIDMPLLEALEAARSENPATRTAAPLERYLEHTGKLNRTNTYGLLRLVLEGPELSRPLAVKCQMAVMKYFARTGQHLVQADYWEIIKPQFDLALRWTWEELSAQGVRQALFLVSFGGCLQLFMDPDALDAVINCKESWVDVPQQLKHLIQSSGIGASLFNHAWLHVARELFKVDVGRGLADLDHVDFATDAVAGFRLAMETRAMELVKLGHSMFEKAISKMTFMGCEMQVAIHTPHDEFEYRLMAHIKSCIVNSGLVEMLPWESLLFERGSIAGVPQHANVPPALYAALATAREVARDFVGAAPMPLGDMIRVMTSKAKHLVNLDRSFALDLHFLTEHAEHMLNSNIRSSVMGALPSVDVRKTVQQALQDVQNLKISRQLASAGPVVRGEVDAVAGLLTNLAAHVGPKAKDVAAFSEFFSLILKRCEAFYETIGEPTRPKVDGLLRFAAVDSKTLVGREALKYDFAAVARKFEEGSVVSLGDLRGFRTFTWMLDDPQAAQVQKWITQICLREDVLVAGSDGRASCSALALASTVPQAFSSSASSSAGAKASKSKAVQKSEEKRHTTQANLLKLFMGKKAM